MAALERLFNSTTNGSYVAKVFASAIKGKTILITGVARKGLGGQTAEILAPYSPKTLVLASRTPSKIQEVIDELQPKFQDVTYITVPLDLSSQKSCREAASSIMSNPQIPQIDILINNAAIMNPPTRELSPDGIEIQFATNHIGHFLFTNLIMPKIIAASRVNRKGTTRIVNVSSRGIVYSAVRFSDINFDKPHETLPPNEQPNYAALTETGRTADPKSTYSPTAAYGQSKTANVLFSLELTSRLYEKYGILSFGLHPGAILTELARNTDPAELARLVEQFKVLFKTLDAGCATTLVAALDDTLGPPAEDGTGIYLSDCQVNKEAPEYVRHKQFAEKLWAESERLVGQKFDI
ncbi:uncharacterized protein Z518_03897 [Rhinocladiella mackenziei CBS 650.93]|uniref:Short-chain dehydrogenase n=1 Tax=Rhinocladiella mackenziei CBS 650.93 TaxID=1442369 RepID=A0A0D2H6A6_9EURO|nr:uncharacterized protein Z518_03897 [Rhinocladiella mackenziei CBS 650.93]KIX05923.1 hypothetical protein Z518_03897 [Rhinocladiella mackenziei CBS 650.93]